MQHLIFLEFKPQYCRPFIVQPSEWSEDQLLSGKHSYSYIVVEVFSLLDPQAKIFRNETMKTWRKARWTPPPRDAPWVSRGGTRRSPASREVRAYLLWLYLLVLAAAARTVVHLVLCWASKVKLNGGIRDSWRGTEKNYKKRGTDDKG